MTDTNHIPTIVFVDDEESILASLRSLFRKQRAGAHYFTNGADALEFIRKHPVDLIVSDMRMPVMNGTEFLRQAAAISPESFRIILSGYEDKQTILQALNDGIAREFILKPWEDRPLQETVESLLGMIAQIHMRKLERLLTQFTDLPSSSMFQHDLKDLLRSDTMPITDLVERIENNPAILAKVLRVANSVFTGSHSHIEDIREAVLFIGMDHISGLILSIETYDQMIRQFPDADAAAVDEIWNTALVRAHIARTLAQKTGASQPSHTVYIASLLQDIGTVIYMLTSPAEYRRFRSLSAGADSLQELEQRIFGGSHPSAGALLLRIWNFPETIIALVEQHHQEHTGNDTALQMLQAADVLAAHDMSLPHDRSIDPRIEEWKELLHSSELRTIDR